MLVTRGVISISCQKPLKNEKSGQKPSWSEALPTLIKLWRQCHTWHLLTSDPLTDTGIGAVSSVENGRLDELGAGLEPSLQRGWLPVNRLALASALCLSSRLGDWMSSERDQSPLFRADGCLSTTQPASIGIRAVSFVETR